jgi:hypothetical protein
MSIQRTHSLINELNELLQRKFPALTMELGAFSVMSARENVSFYEKNTTPPDLLLCLNITKNGKIHCISSISCKIKGGEMEISSKTHRDYEGKKYNLLLRSAMILLAHHIRPITQIVSRAINPISAFSMVKYFNAHSEDLDEYMEENEIEPGEITLADIQAFFDEKSDLGMDEDLTEEEEAALMMENEDFGNITTLVVELNEETMDKARETYMNTLERIGSPEGKGGKRKSKRAKRAKSKSKRTRNSKRAKRKSRKSRKN